MKIEWIEDPQNPSGEKKRVVHPTVTDSGIYGFFGDYRFLSNFHVCDVTVDEITYPSSEHAYMAMKSNDREIRKQFVNILKPSEAKKFGQTIELRDDWDKIKLGVMFDVLTKKFSNPDLQKALFDTGTKYLEETNYWKDTYWGVCDNVGTNHLGNVLMMVRKHINW